MPYVIKHSGGRPFAVATLEEARDAAHDACQVESGAPPIHSSDEYARLMEQVAAISESGGRVGPLSDGTVIEVERVGWATLAETAGVPGFAGHSGSKAAESHKRQIIAAYNEAQAECGVA